MLRPGITNFTVELGDVLDIPSDLLILKHAQGFYGVDRVVALKLISSGLCKEIDLRVLPSDFVVVKTEGVIAPKHVLFIGTERLSDFSYSEMESFSRLATQKIKDIGVPVKTVTTTVHGTGYGLDAGEAIQRLITGFRKELVNSNQTEIESIMFLTLDKRTARMMKSALQGFAISLDKMTTPAKAEQISAVNIDIKQSEVTALAKEAIDFQTRKKRIFVAMPFSEEFENVYEFGIYPATRKCGFICERVDKTHFTGDILTRIRGGIETADFVIADLTDAHPNVYLEVGYAWGNGIPVILVAKKGETPHFDVISHNCIYYGKFSEFAVTLEKRIKGLETNAPQSESQQSATHLE